MKITVRDCLELDAFKSSYAAAGKRNLDNTVRSVSVLDATDLKNAIRQNGVKDRLVLTSFASFKDDYDLQSVMIKELAISGVSALVVFGESKNLKNVKPIETAEASGLPLVIMPPTGDIGYGEVIEQVMDKLLVGDDQRNYLINNTIYHLLAFDKHKTFPAALKEAALSNEFQAVLISKDFNPVLVVETRHKVTVVDAVRKLQKRYEDDGRGIYGILDVEGIAAYWGSININGEEYFLLLVDNEEKYSAVDITKLAEIIELAIGMWKYSPVRDVKAELIKAMMRGNLSLAYTLEDEMDINDRSIISVFFGKTANIPKARDIFEEFERKTGCEVLLITDGDETFGMVVDREQKKSKEKDPEEIGRNCCLTLFDNLKEVSKDIRVFHCTGGSSVESGADGFSLINETWAFVESVFPYKRVFSKYEMALVSNCINIQLQGGHIKRNYDELLEPFVREKGSNKAKQLQDTLETFVLDAGMNSGKTSKIMGIHANTVQYRLKKINEVLGVDITANRVIPALTIALALKRLERVID